MVQGCSTGSLKDASSIQLELALVGLNSYRHWLVGHCLQHKQHTSIDKGYTRSMWMLKNGTSIHFMIDDSTESVSVDTGESGTTQSGWRTAGQAEVLPRTQGTTVPPRSTVPSNTPTRVLFLGIHAVWEQLFHLPFCTGPVPTPNISKHTHCVCLAGGSHPGQPNRTHWSQEQYLAAHHYARFAALDVLSMCCRVGEFCFCTEG